MLIAVGVVYNNARTALAERSWELASLRVLGFTRGEVSGLLLAELNDQGMTVVLVTHEHDVAGWAKRCITFRDGHIVEDRPQLPQRAADDIDIGMKNAVSFDEADIVEAALPD